MKNKDIYVSALRHIGENADVEGNEDYEERAPYLLAAFVGEAVQTAAEHAEANGLCAPYAFECVYLPLEADFPFDKRFAGAAIMYLAAMLIIDENAELSDKLFDRYCDIMSSIRAELPTSIEKIAQRYGV